MFLLKCIIFIAYINYSAGQQCNSNGHRKLDSTFAKLMTLGSSGRRFPENKEDQLKQYCQQSGNYIDDIDKYKTKCMKQLPKQVTGVLLYSMKTQINLLCKKDSKRLTDLIASTPCANSAKHEIDTCYSNVIDAIQGSLHAAEKRRIPHLCCEYFRFYDCIQTKATKNKSCRQFQIDNINDFFKSIFSNVVDLICGDYIEGSDKCDRLDPAPRKKKSQRRTKSFILPMINILASFPEI